MRGSVALTLLVLFIGITAVSLFVSKDLRIQNSIDIAFEEDAPEFVRYRDFINIFGGDELLVIAFESDDIFSPECLRFIHYLTESIRKIRGVTGVTSLTTASRFLNRNYRIAIESLFECAPDGSLIIPDDEELKRIREEVITQPLFVEQIISRDGRATMVVARIATVFGESGYKARILSEVRKVLEQNPLGLKFYIAGPPVAEAVMNSYVTHDLLWFSPIVLGLLAFVLFYIFRSFRLTLLPLLSIGASVVWTGGLVAVTVGTVTLATAVVPPIMLAVGVAMSVHFLDNYEECFHKTHSVEPAVSMAMKRVCIPCLFTALTTAIGFLSLALVDVPAVRQTGFFCAFAVMASFVVIILFLPSLLSLFAHKKPPRERLYRPIRRMLMGIERILKKHILIWITFGLISIIFFLGALLLTVETNLIEYFPHKSEIYQGQSFVSEHLGGAITMDVVVKAKGGDVFEPHLLEKVERLGEFISRQPKVGKVLSLVDVVKEMNATLMGERKLYSDLPFLLEQHASVLKKLREKGGLVKAILSEDFETLRVSVRMRYLPSSELIHLVSTVSEFVEKEFGTSAYVTGLSPLFARVGRNLVEGEKTGLLFAFLAIFLAMLFLLRSAPLAGIAMLPTSIPIIITLGVMGYSKIPVNVSTSMIPCFAIGILVDNAIHYIWRMKVELKAGHTRKAAVRIAHYSVGRPITFTGIILCCGFGALLFSSFSATRNLGLLTILAFSTGLPCTLLLLPELLMRISDRSIPKNEQKSGKNEQDDARK